MAALGNILITGARSPTAFDMAREFIAAGYNVAACEYIKAPLFQKAGIKIYQHSAPNGDFEKFKSDIYGIIADFAPDLIIPINEEIFHFAKLLGNDKKLFAPNINILMQLHSKLAFNNFCIANGIKAPKTVKLSEYNGGFGNKVLKKEFSRFGENILIKPKDNIKINDTSDNPWLVQDFIDGIDASFYAISKNGNIKVFSAYVSDWRTNGGAAYYFSPINGKLFENIFDIATKIAVLFGIDGQFSCDMRIDANGEIWLVECNPRATSGLHLLAGNGGIARAIMGDGAMFAPMVTPTHKAKYLMLPMVFYGLPRLKLLKWLRAISDADDAMAKHNLTMFWAFLEYAKCASQKNMTLSQYLTHDIECNGYLHEY